MLAQISDSITQLSTGGILVVLVLDRVFVFLKSRKESGSDIFARVAAQTDDLHTWHKPNSDGEQAWKNAAITACAKDIHYLVEKQTMLMMRIMPVIERMEQKVQ